MASTAVLRSKTAPRVNNATSPAHRRPVSHAVPLDQPCQEVLQIPFSPHSGGLAMGTGTPVWLWLHNAVWGWAEVTEKWGWSQERGRELSCCMVKPECRFWGPR